MDKAQIVRKIGQLAEERGGHIGFRAFLEASGITEHWLSGQPWFHGWNALLEEVGLQTKTFKVDRTPKETIAEAVAELILRSGAWPTEDALRRERARNTAFPSASIISPIRKTGELARLIVALAKSKPHFASAAGVATEHLHRPQSEGQVSGPVVKGYVYMLRDGRSGKRVKVGKESVEGARQAAAATWLEDPKAIHRIATDDPEGVERYWHERFKKEGKHVVRELFDLLPSDIAAFKAWKKII